ncbi:MAG: hypothetical protein ACOYN5_04790 [Bacteroidales bacterium]
MFRRFIAFFKESGLATQTFFSIKGRLSSFVILLFAVVVIFTNLNNGLWNKKHGVVIHDVISYYSYLPALFIYHDLSFQYLDKDPEFFSGRVFNSKTEEGGKYQKMTMGLSFLYLPFFLLGCLYAWLSGAPVDGYSPPFMSAILFSSVFYAVLGLFFLRKILHRYFRDSITALVLMILGFGTNLFFYSSLEGAMSHAYNFSLITLFGWLTIRWHEKADIKNSIFTGLIFGMITLIRPTNGLVVIFFLLYQIEKWKDIQLKIRLFLKQYKLILLLIAAAFVIILPQLLFWKFNTGHWLFYSYKKEGFFFLKPEIIRGLFSYRKGWFVYTPVMLFAVAGIFMLRKRLREFFIPLLVFTILNIYVIFSWWDWSYGGSFGARAMIDSYGLLAIALAAMMEFLMKRAWFIRWATGLVLIFMLVLNLFQTAQYKYGAIHYCEMSKDAYWYNFGKLSNDLEFYNQLEPMDYSKLIQGEYVVVPRIRETISPPATTGFEELTYFKDKMLSDDKRYAFKNSEFRSDSRKRNGKYSILLFGDRKFGGGIEFYVKPGEKYTASVWKYPANAKASMVFASPDGKRLYKQGEDIITKDSAGWGFVSFEVLIPDGPFEKYRVYLWDKKADSVWFDDLRIEKIE